MSTQRPGAALSPRIVIERGREKPIRNRHPWIFSGAIARVEGEPQPGSIVSVHEADGGFLARGYWNARSQIQVRALTWHDEPIDPAWWAARLRDAWHARAPYRTDPAAAYRLVHAESDYLPGLIIDVYGEWAVVQALTLGIEVVKAHIARLLIDLFGFRGVYERSDAEVRRKEGLTETTGVLAGEAPPERVTVSEDGVLLHVDIAHGHKTGFYLDQRPNRARVRGLAERLAGDGGAHMLNLFSYTGGFGLHALAGGAASAVNVDSSYEALELADAATAANGFDAARAEHIQADVFAYLRDRVADPDSQPRPNLIVCDPPKFAHNASQVERAARGYKDLNLHCFRLIAPGGYLLTFSCSGAVTPDLFTKIVFGALADSGRDAQIIANLGAGEDHPVALTFPEGAYLKGLLVRVR